MNKTIALIGDYRKEVVAHTAIPHALELANTALKTQVSWSWIKTSELNNDVSTTLNPYAAIWVTPGSPYINMDGVINAIRFARETKRAFLGTCGGFQHALIEYARNICGIRNADHAESNPTGDTLIVTQLPCSLAGTSSQIYFSPNSYLEAIFNHQPTTETYSCRYGLNPAWKTKLEAAGLLFTGFDANGDVRAFELANHPFFIGMLCQPERFALQNKSHPLIEAFVTCTVKNK